MRLAKALFLVPLLGIALAASAGATEIIAEHVTGGQLDLHWVGGFDTPNSMYGKTLDASDPAYANPSGDHTVAVAQNASPDSGGLIVTSTDPSGAHADYAWEARIFSGGGETRRGITLRADPNNGFKTFYMFVIEPGLAKLRFRKLINGAPTTIKEWLVFTDVPAGVIPQNTWHKLKVVAQGSQFRCSFDGVELPGQPIVDGEIASGWVGCYNFRFDLGNVPVSFDDLVLSCVSDIAVAFDLTPNTLNLQSLGPWVTGFIEPPSPYTVGDIDVASLRLNGLVGVDPDAPTAVGDHDGDGIPDLAVKFRRADLELALSPGESVPVTLSGFLSGACMSGTDNVRVIRPKIGAPRAGDALTARQTTQVRWEIPAGVSASTVALLSSTDNGASWTLEATGLPNTGSCDWVVPDAPSTAARVAIVQVESSDETGYDVNGVLGTSEPFAIDAALAVPQPGAAFALHGVANPSAGPLRVACSIPTSAPARLAVYDVVGRIVASRDVVGAGQHVVTLLDRAPVGMYVVRLAQAGQSLTTRLTVVR